MSIRTTQLYRIRASNDLVLVSEENGLVFRKPPSKVVNEASVVVEYLPLSQIDLSKATLVNGKVYGSLGLLRIEKETFLSVITSAVKLGTRSQLQGTGTEPIYRILNVEFYCLSSKVYDVTTALQTPSAVPPAANGAGYFASPTAAAGDVPVVYNPCQNIKKILSKTSFYFSHDFDLSNWTQERLDAQGRRLRERATAAGSEPSTGAEAEARRDGEAELRCERDSLQDGFSAPDFGTGSAPLDTLFDYDERFMWNTFMVTPLLKFRASLPTRVRAAFDSDAFVVLAIQGYCGVFDLNIAGQPAILTVISRLGWERAGTRFNVRGIDDNGNVANFVETETIFRTPDLCFAYIQTRGSVPVFWEEANAPPFSTKITLTRPIESSLGAFTKHFETLIENYTDVQIVNLLSSKDQEALLTRAYEEHLRAAQVGSEDIAAHVNMLSYDFHFQSKLGGIDSVKNQLQSTLGQISDTFGCCIVAVDEFGNTSRIASQTGVFRTNCKDCLDRTNVVEDILSLLALHDFINNTHPDWAGRDNSLWSAHRSLFAENGDALSKIYVGTGAINTSFTRSGKKSFAGLLSDASKSVSRIYQSNFIDNGKQMAIDAFLGNLSTSVKVKVFNPIHEAMHQVLTERYGEYTTHASMSIWAGTYNLNGAPSGSESLLPWLFPVDDFEPDILAIGFQEIVKLTPQAVMATDPEKKKRWETYITETLATRPEKQADYVLLRSGQLVGTALLVYVKAELVNDIREVECAYKKTGLGGMAGNKGAVAIRFMLRDTALCFVTAHLAAGHANVEERNSDYSVIANELHFSKGKTLSTHDNIIWMSDTNYRINLVNEEVRALAAANAFEFLYQHDQLNLARLQNKVFTSYYEAPITFKPTYKYDNGTDTYDSSEKQRIPAWTDRILCAGHELDFTRYDRAELFLSDHRPVYGIIRARIRRIDWVKRAKMKKDVVDELMKNHGNVHYYERKLERKLMQKHDDVTGSHNFDAFMLPAPSSDKSAWWDTPSVLNRKLAEPVALESGVEAENPFANGETVDINDLIVFEHEGRTPSTHSSALSTSSLMTSVSKSSGPAASLSKGLGPISSTAKGSGTVPPPLPHRDRSNGTAGKPNTPAKPPPLPQRPRDKTLVDI